MKPKEKHGSTLSRRFRHLLLQLARQARNDLTRIPRHPERAVHALRTRMKKITAILRLVESRLPVRSRRAILGCARRVRKAFAAQRDAHVAARLGFATGRAPRLRPAAPLFEEVSRLKELISREKLAGLTREQVRDAYVRTYRKGRKCMKAAAKDPGPERLHAWRKPVKQLYYQSLALHSAQRMARRLRRARDLGHLLGKYHDWQVILAHTPSAARRLDVKCRRLRRRIFKVAGRLYAKRPGKLARQLV